VTQFRHHHSVCGAQITQADDGNFHVPRLPEVRINVDVATQS
jgi:hypothetical protein